MNKLYYVVCEEKETTLFEGRYQGRTRGGAMKFLKQAIGRKTLNGLVFTITEIPVPLIREIVAEMLAGSDGGTVANVTAAANVVPITRPEPEPKAERFDAFAKKAEPEVKPKQPDPPQTGRKGSKINLGHGEAFWLEVRAFYDDCRSPKRTAERFGVPYNSVKTRALRENWRNGGAQ